MSLWGPGRVSSLGGAGEHAKKKYVWTLVAFATSLYHGLVWSYHMHLTQCQIDEFWSYILKKSEPERRRMGSRGRGG